MDSVPRSPNRFLSALSADDFELVRPHLRTVDLTTEWASTLQQMVRWSVARGRQAPTLGHNCA